MEVAPVVFNKYLRNWITIGWFINRIAESSSKPNLIIVSTRLIVTLSMLASSKIGNFAESTAAANNSLILFEIRIAPVWSYTALNGKYISPISASYFIKLANETPFNVK